MVFLRKTIDTLPGGAVRYIVEADYADNGLFNIKNGGELSFKEAPRLRGPATISDDVGAPYKVVVKASDGGVTNYVEYFKVTVNVLDVEEQGKVTWTVDPDGARHLMKWLTETCWSSRLEPS